MVIKKFFCVFVKTFQKKKIVRSKKFIQRAPSKKNLNAQKKVHLKGNKKKIEIKKELKIITHTDIYIISNQIKSN